MSFTIVPPNSVIPRGRIALDPHRGLFMIECSHEERAFFMKKVVWTPVNKIIETLGVRDSVVHYFNTRDEAIDHARTIGIDLLEEARTNLPRGGMISEAS